MAREVIYTVNVEFGDCDPAQIVWFPRFFGWIDAASRNFFVKCGVPHWSETAKTIGVIGTPIVDTKCKFMKTATYGDTLEVHTSVTEWREKSFVQHYRITRTNPDASVDVILECDEVRIFGGKREDGSLRAMPVPPSIRAVCE